MTCSLAVELAHRNPRVRVNCILPGPVMLPEDLSAAEREQVVLGDVIKTSGTPQHIVQAVLHLIENDFITGVSLLVDGGRTLTAFDAQSAALDESVLDPDPAGWSRDSSGLSAWSRGPRIGTPVRMNPIAIGTTFAFFSIDERDIRTVAEEPQPVRVGDGSRHGSSEDGTQPRGHTLKFSVCHMRHGT